MAVINSTGQIVYHQTLSLANNGSYASLLIHVKSLSDLIIKPLTFIA